MRLECSVDIYSASQLSSGEVTIMKGGRKNLMRAAMEETLTLQEGQNVMQVVSLRGSNLIEVMDAQGEKALAIFPAKFQKSMWIKRGNFVLVDDSGREEAIDSGRKVTCFVVQVLFHEQARVLQKSPEWPEIFKSSSLDKTDGNLQANTSLQQDGEVNSSDDDGLPLLERNTNRRKHVEFSSDTESDSDLES